MNRRVFLTSVPTVAVISGCSLGGRRGQPTRAETNITNVGDRCTGEQNNARVVEAEENTIRIEGTIPSVDSTESIRATTYASSEESEILTRIYTADAETQTRDCNGSLSYEATVTYTNIDPSSARILHDSNESVIVTETTL
ncbi:hypothetical protein NDI85_12190 [Halomicroarcula sp. S1AR25-4]|uniref:hypothetical protein n=1 Tax=Haloarcula sp. S1AR25-4 TaxID=2950538 RepID=UPI002875C3CF|nr:hypothetical protein [Halomicroarcula sp. S1AR25-4]MDS0278558.1 hypothetical protein [Halomicroarcula sp. S1AR25-4]